MRISKISVANHQAMPDVDLDVREHLVLVGPNESGKTSLLRLLDAILSGSQARLYAVLDAESIRDVTQPMVATVELNQFDDLDKAAFADQIEVLPDSSTRLRVSLRATLDPTSGELAIERLFLKPGPALRASVQQLRAIGWVFLPANRSPDRELGPGQASAVRSLLKAVELGASLDDIRAAVDRLHLAVAEAPPLTEVRKELSSALSELLPRAVTAEDLTFTLTNTDEDDPLGDVDVKLRRDGGARSLRQQSDGIRAMSTVAIQLLTKSSARIVAVDEPEIHLHPRAQGRVGSLLRSKTLQTLVATHSPTVLARFSPMHAVAISPSGTCRQLASAPFAASPKSVEHWWTSPALEPLTSRGVVIVEGAADRVIVEAVARCLGHDLDQLCISVATLNGAGGFKMALRLFGTAGFDVPYVGIVDVKEAVDVAKYLEIPEAEVPTAGFTICDADLEAECVRALGSEAHANALCASGLFNDAQICSANGVTALSALDEALRVRMG